MKMFILTYSTGSYEEYSNINFAAVSSEEKAIELTKDFDSIGKWFEAKSVIFYEDRNKFMATQPALPDYPSGRIGKQKNPVWAAMSQKEWQIFLLDYKTNVLAPLIKAYKEATEKNNLIQEEWSKKWWEEMMISFPTELKDRLEIYPAQRINWEAPEFGYEELPVWDSTGICLLELGGQGGEILGAFTEQSKAREYTKKYEAKHNEKPEVSGWIDLDPEFTDR